MCTVTDLMPTVFFKCEVHRFWYKISKSKFSTVHPACSSTHADVCADKLWSKYYYRDFPFYIFYRGCFVMCAVQIKNGSRDLMNLSVTNNMRFLRARHEFESNSVCPPLQKPLHQLQWNLAWKYVDSWRKTKATFYCHKQRTTGWSCKQKLL